MNRSFFKALIWLLIACHLNLIVGCMPIIPSPKEEKPGKTAPKPTPEPLPIRENTLTIVEFQVDVDKSKTKIVPFSKLRSRLGKTLIAPAGIEEVTDHIRVKAGNHRFDPRNKIFSFDVTLTNTAQTAVFTPLKTIIENLRPSSATVVNADGGGKRSGAFWNYDNFIGFDLRLSAGETSSARNLQFHTPQLQQFSFFVRVEGYINHPPKFISPPVTKANTGEIYLYAAKVDDVDGDSLTYTLVDGPAGMEIDSLEGVILWPADSIKTGTHRVELRVKDAKGESDSQRYEIAVNRPPVITSVPITAVRENAAYTYQVEATDPDGDQIVYRLVDPPAGMTIDSTRGLVTWNAKIDTTIQGRTGATASQQQSATASGQRLTTASLPGAATCFPESLSLRLTPNELVNQTITVKVPASPPIKTDVFIIVDLTASFEFDDLPRFKQQAPNIIASLVATGLDVHFGVSWFKDYPIPPFGLYDYSSVGQSWPPDTAYKRAIDLTSLTQDSDSDGTPDIIEAINNLSAGGGGDVPESQLPALLQAATGQGQLNVPVPSFVPRGAADIAPRQQASLRPGSVPIFIVWTDAPSHKRGDPGGPPFFTSYPGPNVNGVLDSLNAKGIKVVGIVGGSNANALADMNTVVSGTLTLSPAAGVDCNGDGTIDIAGGEPIICRISNSGVGIAEAIVSTVGAVALSADLTITPVDNPNTPFDETAFVAAIKPDTISDANLGAGGSFNFQVTFRYPSDAPNAASFTLASRADETFLCDVGVSIERLIGQRRNVVVVADDRRGGFDAQDYALAVIANNPPRIISTPVTEDTINTSYRYDVEAKDEDQDALTFALLKAPDGMTIDPNTGVITWLPAQAGLDTVTVQVRDDHGGADLQQFLVSVFDLSPVTNAAPIIISIPPLSAAPSIAYRYQVSAIDLNRDPITFSLPTKPAGMAINANGLITWTPIASQLGNHPVEVQAHDGQGGIGRQNYTVTVAADTTPPTINLFLQTLRTPLGAPVTATVQARDDVGVASVSLQVNGTPLPLDPNNQAIFTPAQLGKFVFVAAATDFAGNQGTANATLTVFDPNDVAPPRVDITSPEPGDNITFLADVIGTVFDDNLVRYSLAYAEFRDEEIADADFIEIASGTENKANEVLGAFDPTVLMNGSYVIRLQAEDLSGFISSVTTEVTVSSELKIGNFTLTFTDLSIPVSGIPITITRTYDSRDKQVRDFGVGWSMGLKTIDLQEDVNRNVTITLPDGRRVTFPFTLTPSRNPVIAFASWQPEPGVYDKLEMIGDRRVLYSAPDSGEFVIVGFFDRLTIPYNCYEIPGYVLTTREGMRFTIPKPLIRVDEFGNLGCGTAMNVPVYDEPRLTEVRDLNNNTLTFTDDGIIHSSGKSITWEKDEQGRITRIIDPMGNDLLYNTDDYGDLVRFINQVEDTTRFVYGANHFLEDIIDPRGVRAIRSEYDDNGRLIATTDAAGNRIEIDHDLGNRQEIIRDRLGNPTISSYDERGNVLAQTDPLNNTIKFINDTNNNQTAEINALGDTTKFTYDNNGNLLTETDPLGNTTTFTYNARNEVLTLTDPLGNTIINLYDAKGNLLAATDPVGNVTTNTYDTKGNLTLITDSFGNFSTFNYDASGNLTREVDPIGAVATYICDKNGNRLTTNVTRTDAQGNLISISTTNVYDGNNRLIQVTDPHGNSIFFEYNSLGRKSVSIDKNGNRTKFEYDSVGNLIKTSYPDNTIETTTFDANTNRLSFTDRAGRTTRFEYDALNRLTRTTFPDGSFTLTEYDAAGRVTATIDENGNRKIYEYNTAGRNTKVIDPLGNITIFTYNNSTISDFEEDAGIVSLTDANSNTTTFEYDANNRRIKTIFPDGTFTKVAYNSLGQKNSETDQAGNTTQFEYDASDRLTKVIDALSNETAFTYDEVGNRLTQTDANGHTTRWVYDNLGRVISRTLPLGMTETFTYDANGNILTRTDFNGQTTTFTYDVNNRLITKTFHDGTEVKFTYTATGNRSSVTDSRGVTTFRYDLRNRLIESNNPGGSSITYTYDAAGNRTSVTVPSGTTTYTYDALNRLSTAIDSHGDVTTYTYDNVGNRFSVTYPNGTKTNYAYDNLNRLISLENKKSSGDVISRHAYSLGPAGNRLSIVEHTGRKVDYTYDTLYRLLEERITDPVLGNQISSFTYDPVGNRLSKTDTNGSLTYTYDANDRLLTEGEKTYTYDNNGSTLSRRNGLDTTTYTYDFENNLISVKASKGVTEYRYDVDGTRVQSIVNGAITNFLVDKNRDFAQVLEERDDAGALIVNYVYGNDLISQERSGSTFFYHYDGLGSTRALTDVFENVSDTYTYEAFGTLLASTGSTANSFLFTGEQFDPNIGFYYLRARYYAPELGRFISADPFLGLVFDPITLHKYLYAGADPINNVDPGGLQFGLSLADIIVTSAIIGIISGYATYVGTGSVQKAVFVSASVFVASFVLLGGVGLLTVGSGIATTTAVTGGAAVPISTGLLRPNTWQQAQAMLGQVLNLRPNTAVITLRGMLQGRIPDYVSQHFIADAKFVQRLFTTDQIRDFVVIAQTRQVPLYIFVRVNTYVTGPVLQLIRSTGGDVVRLYH